MIEGTGSAVFKWARTAHGTDFNLLHVILLVYNTALRKAKSFGRGAVVASHYASSSMLASFSRHFIRATSPPWSS